MPAIRHARPAIGIAFVVAAIVVLSTAINCSRGVGAKLPVPPPRGGNQLPPAVVPALPGPNPKPDDFLSDEVLATLEPEELVNLARKTRSEDHRVRYLEAAAKQAPDDPEILRCLIVAHEVRGLTIAERPGGRTDSMPDFDRGAEVARMWLALDGELSDGDREVVATALYNEACNHAVRGEPDLALDVLEEAIGAGFNAPVIFEDQDLDTLRSLDRFQSLLERIPEPEPE